MRTYIQILLVGLALMIQSNCAEDKDDDNTDNETIGSLASDDGDGTTGVELVTNDINNVQKNMVPGSLAVDSSSTSLLNPCEGLGFFECQPHLLKLFMNITKLVIKDARFVLADAKDIINGLSANSQGEEEFEDDGHGVIKATYDVTSAKKFKLILHSTKGAFVYLDADLTETVRKYSMTFDDSLAPVDEQNNEANGGKMEVTVSYTAEKDFEVTITNIEECDSSDIRAPQNIQINVTVKDNVWTGKTMLYHPRWLYQDGDGTTCSTPSNSSIAMYNYTDWVGNDTNTSAALYLLPEVTSTDQFSTYPASAFCTNFSGSCNNGYGFGDSNPVSTYTNPYCATTAKTATWGSACSDFPTSKFSDASKWTLPKDLNSKSISVPSSL